MKKIIATMLIFALSFFLSSCYDNREIDQTAYVIAVGIDKGKDRYNYTFQISSPLAMGGNGETPSTSKEEDKNTRVENIVIGAKDLYEARNSLNRFLSKKVNLSHLKIIVFSSEVAQEGLSQHMPFLLKEREVRPNTNICISETTAEKFLSGINPALEANTAEYYDLIAKNSSVFAPPKTLREFINEQSMFASAVPVGRVSEYKSSEDFPDKSSAPLRVSPSKSEFSGLYLLKNNKIAGELTPTQSCIYALLTNKIDGADLTVEKDGKSHMVRLSALSPSRFSVYSTDASTTIKLNADFSAEVNSFGEPISEYEIEKYLITEADALFMNIQRSGCDIFGVGNILRRRCKTVYEWESLNWNKAFTSTYFSPNITVVTERNNFGTM